MATYTTNYNLCKPELTDSPPDITVLNANFDTIDSELDEHAKQFEELLNNAVNALVDASISGKTITVTFKDGTTKTLNTQDTTYSPATTSTAGLMSAADKTKLNGITAGAGGSMTLKSSLTGSLSKSTSSVTKTITGLIALKPIYIYLYTTYQETSDYWAMFNAITGLKHGNFTGGTTACPTTQQGLQQHFIPNGTSISITLKLNQTSNYSNINYKIEVYQ